MLQVDIINLPVALAGQERAVPASWNAAKRTIDLGIGSLALLFALPLIALAALAIVIVDPGNPFFTQERVGKHGRRFRLWKLRTMVHGAHQMRHHVAHLNECDGPVFKIKRDPRLHRIGAFLRSTSIDELPNLFNVVRGDMSLVGPRPPLTEEVEHYSSYALRRLTAMPGITCLWQINGRSSVNFDEWMRLDNLYIDTWSPVLDLKILLKTIPAVLRKEGAH